MIFHAVVMACFHYLLLAYVINGRISATTSIGDFFPFGPDRNVGDSQLLDDNDDDQPLYFPDSQMFPFFGKKYQLLFVSYLTV